MGTFKKGHKPYIPKMAKGIYILAYKGSRRDAKRHIITRSDDLDYLKAKLIELRATKPKWTIHIYNGAWEVID